MEAKKEDFYLASETVKQTFFSLLVEVFFAVIFGELVSRLSAGLVLIFGGPLLYVFNPEMEISAIFGLTFPVVGLLLVISDIRDIVKKIKKEQALKP